MKLDDIRDNTARIIATWAFNLATEAYRHRLTRAIELGLPLAWEEEKAKAPKFNLDWINRKDNGE